MAVVSRRIFDTDNALKASFNGLYGKWQLITYSFFVFGYAIIAGWISNLHTYTLLKPKSVDCTGNQGIIDNLNLSTIQRLNVRNINGSAFQHIKFNFSKEYGQTVVTQFEILCDLEPYIKAPRFSHYIGFFLGSFILGFASDRGGRKMIILACIWTTGVMSLFQLVGHDFISYVFFQFFIGLFIGGVYSSFLPAIIEMFPINLRTFYGVFFHLVVCLFELILPWLSKSFKSWELLQIFVTAPVIITAVLQWLVSESIFWYLAHKEYDKAIKVLTKLAKRNGINFESKFKEARDFLHAKHSKATQVDILPLLRLQDLEILGKKYPQVDMAELQKQKSNSSKLRRFLNSLKGANYRSTNTIYRPFDFIYSPPLLIYVLILSGLWLTNGFTDSMESIRKPNHFDFYVQNTFSNLFCVLSSTLAITLAIFKIGRKWMIFLSYLIMEICLLGSLIANLNNKDNDEQTEVTLNILYHLCKFSSHFGFIFLMLITAELYPTSLRCTGMGISFSIKMIGSMISSPNLMNYNTNAHRLAYCILTLVFGSFVLFLPETKTFPLPRSILQIEAMPTAIGKKLRSRKVKLACEKRQTQLTDRQNQPLSRDQLILYNQSMELKELNENVNGQNNVIDKEKSSIIKDSTEKDSGLQTDGNKMAQNNNNADTYDTVTSVHDIEQDDHHYYMAANQPLLSIQTSFEPNKLSKIVEVPSKNITRNNSMSDLDSSNKV